MRSTLALAIGLLLVLGCGAANAADPRQLAETGAYLLGNAYRCGVPTKRVKDAGKVIRDLIVVAAGDSAKATAAESRFVEIFLASAAPSEDQEGFPSCKIVIAQFKRLEQHHRQPGLN
jgi:hypothetical protein